jgi:hypothetical protein
MIDLLRNGAAGEARLPNNAVPNPVDVGVKTYDC